MSSKKPVLAVVLLLSALVLATASCRAQQAEANSVQEAAADTGEDKPAYELIPTEPDEQEAVFQRLAERTYTAKSHRDQEGNYIWVCFNHHKIYRKNNPDAPGLTDADMPLLLHFPKLEGVTLQAQGLTDEGYKVLGAFSNLKVAALPNPARPFERPEGVPDPTKDFVKPLRFCRDLRVLDITHTFGIHENGLTNMDGFPELRYLSVDVGFSGPDLLPFLEKCPKIEVLRLHRTPMGDADLKKVLELCPNLRFLMVKRQGKPQEPMTDRTLRHLKDHENIEVFRFSHNPPELAWEDGLEHLVGVPSLKVFMTKPETKVEEGAFERLKEARPDLKIVTKGNPWEVMPMIINEYPWDFGPR